MHQSVFAREKSVPQCHDILKLFHLQIQMSFSEYSDTSANE